MSCAEGSRNAIALDATSVSSLLLDAGPNGQWVESLMADRPYLIASEAALLETTNIIRNLEQRRDISRLEANIANRDLQRLDLLTFPVAPFSERIWQLRTQLSAFDAASVALAERFECPLATLDARVAEAVIACEVLQPPG